MKFFVSLLRGHTSRWVLIIFLYFPHSKSYQADIRVHYTQIRYTAIKIKFTEQRSWSLRNLKIQLIFIVMHLEAEVEPDHVFNILASCWFGMLNPDTRKHSLNLAFVILIMAGQFLPQFNKNFTRAILIILNWQTNIRT